MRNFVSVWASKVQRISHPFFNLSRPVSTVLLSIRVAFHEMQVRAQENSANRW